jgi:hypothetical protein
MSPPVWNSAQAVKSAHVAIRRSKVFMMSVLSLEVCPTFEAGLPKGCTIPSVLRCAPEVPIARRYLDEYLRTKVDMMADLKADAGAHAEPMVALPVAIRASGLTPLQMLTEDAAPRCAQSPSADTRTVSGHRWRR